MNKVRVEMLVSIAGLPEPRYELDDFSFMTGQIVELHPALASAWCKGGLAKLAASSEEVPVAPAPEVAAVEPREETATLPSPKPKKPRERT